MKIAKSLINISVTLIIVLALWYGALIVFKVENLFIYHPTHSYIEIKDARYAAKREQGTLQSKDGTQITYWFFGGDKDKPVILFTHGNAQNMSYFVDFNAFLLDRGYPVMMYDYRGYGQSGAKPEEKGIYEDIEAVTELLNDKFGYENKDIILIGHSLGGAVTIDAASKNDFKAVVINSTFTNTDEYKQWLESRSVVLKILIWPIKVAQKFDSLNKIEKINSPLLLMHSVPDEVIPYQMSEKLAQRNPRAVLIVSQLGSHNDPVWFNGFVTEFLETVK